MRIDQRAAYDALATTLAGHGLQLIIGVPTALQALPAAYLVSTQIEVVSTFVVRLRPTLTLAVAWQDQAAAELAIVDLVDLIAPDLYAPLANVCRAAIETVSYGWRNHGGIDYRIADLVLVLSQM